MYRRELVRRRGAEVVAAEAQGRAVVAGKHVLRDKGGGVEDSTTVGEKAPVFDFDDGVKIRSFKPGKWRGREIWGDKPVPGCGTRRRGMVPFGSGVT